MRGANERQNFFTNYTGTILKAYIFRSKDHVHRENEINKRICHI